MIAAMTEALLEALPDGRVLMRDTDPPAGFRAELGQRINAYHSETVPHAARRFALALRGAGAHDEADGTGG